MEWTAETSPFVAGMTKQFCDRMIGEFNRCGGRFAPIELLLSTHEGLSNLAEPFLTQRESFRLAGKPIHIYVGFHYTYDMYLESIRQKGMVIPDDAWGVFGPGIYVANNPRAFVSYGTVGLVVIYIQGVTRQLTRYNSSIMETLQADTLVGNKRAKPFINNNKNNTEFPSSPYFDEIVLRTSSQVLPLFTYPKKLVNSAEMLFEFQSRLQSLVDNMFNQGPTPVRRMLPSKEDVEYEHSLRPMAHWKKLSSQRGKSSKHKKETIKCCGPDSFKTKSLPYSLIKTKKETECTICFCKMEEEAKLHKCQHSFHPVCLDTWLKTPNNTCPTCRVQLGEPTGKCPPGTMTIQYDDTKSCNGLRGVYVIWYDIPSGIQSYCHDNPGTPFSGDFRTAYVPSDGQPLLKRLKYAFQRGLTFMIGTSLTSGLQNVITWASIHHKTSLSAGPHGFPDSGFYLNCHEELDSLGVPKAEDL